jgi:hypothetical protein
MDVAMKGENMKKPKGLHPYRFKDNAEEKLFAEAWAKQNEQGHTLAYLLHVGDQGGQRPVEPSDRDHVVAATVVQWLGSHVGECFLRDLGYLKGKTWT